MSLRTRLALHREPLFLMDGSAFIFRGFFANRTMRRSDGFPTNALAVVSRILLRILRGERPRYFAFIQDGKGKNFRHEIYAQYKANRDATPEDLVRQLEPIRQLVRALGLRLEVSRGCEADDCIASLAARFSEERPVIIISGDKDLKQCLGPNVYMWDPAAKEEKLTDASAFTAESGIAPQHWPDMQALIGDSSDNIPGVPGIGPKTARQICAICPTLEDIRDRFSLLPPKIQDKLRDHLETIFTWRKLTRLSRGECADLTLDDLRVQPPDEARCAALAGEFELFALRRELETLLRGQPQREGSPTHPAVQPSSAANTDAVEGVMGGATASHQASVPIPPPVPPLSGEGAEQGTLPGTLLDTPQPPQPLAQAPEARTTADLPSCAGRRAALVWASGPGRPPHVAVDADPAPQEFLWLGRMEELRRWLGDAALLVAADSKALLAAPWAREEDASHASRTAWPPHFDLGLAAYLLDPEEGDYGWARLYTRYGVMLEHPEQRGPAALALDLENMLRRRMEAADLLPLYRHLELPLTPVLAGMEARGVAIDAAAFQSFLADVQTQLDTLSAEVHRAAGHDFNIRSAQQLGEVLFGELGLPAPRRTKGGQASTSQRTLEKLAGKHPVVDSVLRFRKLEKMRSTYLDPLPRLTDAQGRLHTTFNQTATATGRLSSSNPNLQNIPVRGPLGKRMRACFIAGAGRRLISADYSQVELRVLAHMSQDAALLDAFRHGADIHARTAALIYDVPQAEVSSDQRRNAKTINFGLIYGMGAQKLGQELHIPLAEAKAFIARYFERLTGLKAFYDRVEAEARRQGFVATLGGRRRPLPAILSANGQAFALARRQAINTVIQGSAADIIKLAMLAVARDVRLRALDARLLLQVHDELVLDAPEEHAGEAGARVAELMAGVEPGGAPLSLPLAVDWGTGDDWGAAH